MFTVKKHNNIIMIKNLIIIATGIISLFYSCQKETYTIDKENDIKEKISIQNGSITSLSEFALKVEFIILLQKKNQIS